jgi:outer membrane lipoprotein
MSWKQLLKVMAFWCILLTLSACAYPISKETRAKGEEDDSVFTRVLKDPTSYAGSIILWGGKIIETLNYPNGTEIFVLETPVDYKELPESEKYSHGRFIARTSKLLDPSIYAKGKWITVAGEVVGKETMPLGKTWYTYPVVQIREVNLWDQGTHSPARSEWPSFGYGYSPYDRSYGWGWYDPEQPPYDWGDDMGIE